MNVIAHGLAHVILLAAPSVFESLPLENGAFDPALSCYEAVDADGSDAELAAMFQLAKGGGDDARAALRLLADAGGGQARASLAAVLCGHPDASTRAQAADLLGDDRAGESAFVLALAADLESDGEVRDVVLANLERLVGPATAARERDRAHVWLAAR